MIVSTTSSHGTLEALVLLEQIHGDECPSDFNLLTALFWIKAHGLYIRAMTKSVGEDLDALLGEVLKVRNDSGSAAIGRCIRIHARVDINKPLVRWTNIDIEGTSCRIIFRYEKLTVFCYFCGRLNHLDKDYKHI